MTRAATRAELIEAGLLQPTTCALRIVYAQGAMHFADQRGAIVMPPHYVRARAPRLVYRLDAAAHRSAARSIALADGSDERQFNARP